MLFIAENPNDNNILLLLYGTIVTNDFKNRIKYGSSAGTFGILF